jgi:hypothetical protein
LSVWSDLHGKLLLNLACQNWCHACVGIGGWMMDHHSGWSNSRIDTADTKITPCQGLELSTFYLYQLASFQ